MTWRTYQRRLKLARRARRAWRWARARARYAAQSTAYVLCFILGDPVAIFDGPPNSESPCLTCDAVGACSDAYSTAGHCPATETK
jgi:hypothetical protein